MSEQSTTPSRSICATCTYWEAPRHILAFSVAWNDSSARCGNRRSPGFGSNRSDRSGCGSWKPLVGEGR